MKKLFGYILSFAMVLMLVVTPAEHVYAQGLGLSVSSNSVSVGKTVKVTVSMPSGYFGTVVVTSSDEGVLSNGGDGVCNIGDAASYPTSQSFTFTAKGAGTCTIKAYCTVVGDAEGNDAGGTITGSSTTVTVTSGSSNNGGSTGQNGNNNNGSGDSNNNNGGDNTDQPDDSDKEPEKSSDSSLSSLIISAGSLSPEFAAGTKDYTTTVDYSVSSLAVTATPADSKATVTSVTGNDSLEVGENTVSIVVTAENGATSTYNIVVTRRSEDDPENSDQQENWKKFDINGTEWTMINDIPEDIVPEGFEHSKTVIDGLEYNTLHSTFGDITLIYMQSDSGSSLFVYDAAQNAAYDYVRINSESHFIVALLANVDDVPEGYNEVSLSIEGKGVVTAYQSKDDSTDKDFYLIYAMNDQGESGWYTYDSVDGTYIRTDVTVPTVAQEENDTAKNELIPGVENKYLAVAAALVIIIIILLIILIVTNVRRKNKDVEDYDDEDEYSEDEDLETDASDDEYDTIDPESEEDEVSEADDDQDEDQTETEDTDETVEAGDTETDDVNTDIDDADEADDTDEVDDTDDTDEIDDVEVETVKSETNGDAQESSLNEVATEKTELEETDTESADIESDAAEENPVNDEEEILPQIDISSVMDDSSETVKETEEAEPVVRRTVEIKSEEESIEQQVQQALDEFSKKDESTESAASDDDNDDLEIIDLN